MGSRPAEVAVGVPALAPERQVTWPKRTRTRLANGLEVILAESHTIPKFHGELLFRSGNAAAADLFARVGRVPSARFVPRPAGVVRYAAADRVDSLRPR